MCQRDKRKNDSYILQNNNISINIKISYKIKIRKIPSNITSIKNVTDVSWKPKNAERKRGCDIFTSDRIQTLWETLNRPSTNYSYQFEIETGRTLQRVRTRCGEVRSGACSRRDGNAHTTDADDGRALTDWRHKNIR